MLAADFRDPSPKIVNHHLSSVPLSELSTNFVICTCSCVKPFTKNIAHFLFALTYQKVALVFQQVAISVPYLLSFVLFKDKLVVIWRYIFINRAHFSAEYHLIFRKWLSRFLTSLFSVLNFHGLVSSI